MTPVKSEHAQGWPHGAPNTPPTRVDIPGPVTQSSECRPRGMGMLHSQF